MCVLIFSTTLPKKVLIPGIIKRYIIINVRRCSWKVQVIRHILTKLEVPQQIFQKYSNIKFHANPSSGAELFQADGRTDRHDEASSHTCQFLKAPKILNLRVKYSHTYSYFWISKVGKISYIVEHANFKLFFHEV